MDSSRVNKAIRSHVSFLNSSRLFYVRDAIQYSNEVGAVLFSCSFLLVFPFRTVITVSYLSDHYWRLLRSISNYWNIVCTVTTLLSNGATINKQQYLRTSEKPGTTNMKETTSLNRIYVGRYAFGE